MSRSGRWKDERNEGLRKGVGMSKTVYFMPLSALLWPAKRHEEKSFKSMTWGIIPHLSQTSVISFYLFLLDAWDRVKIKLAKKSEDSASRLVPSLINSVIPCKPFNWLVLWCLQYTTVVAAPALQCLLRISNSVFENTLKTTEYYTNSKLRWVIFQQVAGPGQCRDHHGWCVTKGWV